MRERQTDRWSKKATNQSQREGKHRNSQEGMGTQKGGTMEERQKSGVGSTQTASTNSANRPPILASKPNPDTSLKAAIMGDSFISQGKGFQNLGAMLLKDLGSE